MQTQDPLTGEDAVQWKRYKIMEHMHWNLWEYENTPASLIDQIWTFMATESKYEEMKLNEANHG